VKNQVVLLLILVVLVSLVIHAVPLVKADTTIYIRSDGNIVGTNLIARNGNTYTFTANITVPIHVERGGVIVDGAGYTLEGHKVGDGLNLTCSNSTIKNLRIADWNTAIFGAYHNNAIISNIIINCEYGIKIYADSYQIIGNTIMDCDNSICLHGGDHLITRNNITRNGIGVYIRGYASYLKNTVIENTFTRNINAIALIQSTTCQKIYHNNFINNKYPNNSYTIYGRPYNLITTCTTDANGNIIETVFIL